MLHEEFDQMNTDVKAQNTIINLVGDIIMLGYLVPSVEMGEYNSNGEILSRTYDYRGKGILHGGNTTQGGGVTQ